MPLVTTINWRDASKERPPAEFHEWPLVVLEHVSKDDEPEIVRADFKDGNWWSELDVEEPTTLGYITHFALPQDITTRSTTGEGT